MLTSHKILKLNYNEFNLQNTNYKFLNKLNKTIVLFIYIKHISFNTIVKSIIRWIRFNLIGFLNKASLLIIYIFHVNNILHFRTAL